jgi:hypothetical protein
LPFSFLEKRGGEGMPYAAEGVGRQRQRQERHRRVQWHRDHHQLDQQTHRESHFLNKEIIITLNRDVGFF